MLRVTEAVNVISDPAVGLVVVVVIDTTGCGLAVTVTEVPPLEAFPNASKAVTLTAKVPPVVYV